MAGVESGQAADDDAAARQAAEVAVELSEAEGPADKKRITRALQYVAGRGASSYVSPDRKSKSQRSSEDPQRYVAPTLTGNMAASTLSQQPIRSKILQVTGSRLSPT